MCDVKHLPFKEDVFDIVWNEGVNEHFVGRERQLLFNEMARVTRINGRVVIFVPNAYSIPRRFSKFILEAKGIWEAGFEKPFSLKELKRRMERAGLRVVDCDGYGAFSSLTLPMLRLAWKRISRKFLHDEKYVRIRESIKRKGKRRSLLNSLFGDTIGVCGMKSG